MTCYRVQDDSVPSLIHPLFMTTAGGKVDWTQDPKKAMHFTHAETALRVATSLVGEYPVKAVAVLNIVPA